MTPRLSAFAQKCASPINRASSRPTVPPIERADDVGERRLTEAIFERDDHDAGDRDAERDVRHQRPRQAGCTMTAQYAITATNTTRASHPTS